MTIDLSRFFVPRPSDCCPYCGRPHATQVSIVIAGQEIKEAVQPLRPRQPPAPAPEPDGEEDP